ncbi:hypothetical protein AVEN_179792-1 [Araneus ventricosus]|uniref:Uncharacterized protein n=1 Tax=Araneus ventricosus TaxID=182803 RepID=A0A4Y2G2Q0_ARAVE|nr:hypothetical protein AVEN_179792-1 [Araneus ventricosus]
MAEARQLRGKPESDRVVECKTSVPTTRSGEEWSSVTPDAQSSLPQAISLLLTAGTLVIYEEAIQMGATIQGEKIGLRVERRHHLQSACLQDAVLVDQTDENCLGLSLVGQCYNIHLTAQTCPKRVSSDDDDVQHEVLLWMRQQPKNFMQRNWGADKTMG